MLKSPGGVTVILITLKFSHLAGWSTRVIVCWKISVQ